MTNARPKPLLGIKVVELARILAGPWAGQVLADLGADVVKVESPQGDDTRKWGPPFIGREHDNPDAAYFHACNRGKTTIIADFNNTEDRDRVLELIADADVLIENFRPHALQRFGLDYETLRLKFPRLVYCAITGFGQEGPYAARPGYDAMIQAMSGLMSITGEAGGPPQKIGVALADITTGLYSVIAIQSALWERQRTGVGRFIDMALLDCAVGVLANQAMNTLITGASPDRMGNAHPSIVPYETFQCSDGEVMLAVGNNKQFNSFCANFGLLDVAEDLRFRTIAGRVEHREELIPVLCKVFKDMTKADVLSRCQEAQVPAGPVNSIAEALSDPQVRERQMVMTLDNGQPAVRTPIMYDGAPVFSTVPPPALPKKP
ncbi:MAG: CaiB/BaiF CoA-transferase family protein [Pseudomonadota bacterium]